MQSETTKIAIIVAISTLIFLLMPLFLILYIKSYNGHKKKHFLEKESMQQKFESEMMKARIEVQDQTMQTIATEIHDNVGQLLSLTTLTLNSINLNNTEKATQKIDNSLSLVNKSIKELRELARLLHGEKVIENGLGNALEQEINWLDKAGVYKLKVNNTLFGLHLSSPDKDLIILRLLQEIINNIIKHSQATNIEIDANFADGILNLQVLENGIGFIYDKTNTKGNGMGLNSINKRIEMINGKLTLISEINKGTSITIAVPYP